MMVLIGTRHYQREHILVMEQVLGRPLDPASEELVHHIDTDKLNNELSNLVLLPDELAHKKAHKSLASFGPLLVKVGLVTYDREKNEYNATGQLLELLAARKGAT